MYKSFWGKARALEEGVRWHPTAYHCLDVAACCELLLKRFSRFAGDFAAAADVSREDAERFITMLVALHDIGKFSIGFQAKVPEHYPAVLGSFPANPPDGDHTAIGQEFLDSILRDEVRNVASKIGGWSWAPLISAVSGHHGRPASDYKGGRAFIGQAAELAAQVFLLDVQDVFGFGGFPGKLNEKNAKRLSWHFAGLVTLADWIGSNQHVFRYEPPEWDLKTYWERFARPRAEIALGRSGLLPVAVSPHSGFKALTRSAYEPSPLQLYAENVQLAETGPQLFLIEDMTGAGKTEAAIILAHRLMQSGRADGIFVALPTMATANAMYDRMKDMYRRLFKEDATPSLVLAHGARNLHEGFASSILDVVQEELGYDDTTSSAACAAWIADDRRKAFFAHIGVGTIDQALLAVLPSKFAPLRLCGLANRILIIDEAHSYDSYMREEMETLIRFHAAQGGSTIVLSATLPDIVTDGLVNAFRRGLGQKSAALSLSQSYPLATMMDAEGQVISEALATRADLPRSVPVRRLNSRDEAHAAILQAAAAGAAVAYICNTVDDARASYEYLKEQHADVVLFHARFAMKDRLTIEQHVLGLVGKTSGPDGRRGRIVVATQVIEASLDIDFDLLVTDLAPMDLLIQRAGRLWRHMRACRPLAGPELMVVSPPPVEDAQADWYEQAFPLARWVYEDHARLWKTAKTLFDEGKLVSPQRVRWLVESVYGKDALEDIPNGLMQRREAADGNRKGEKCHAENILLKLEDGYVIGENWRSEQRVRTRLSKEQTILRLARIENGILYPWAKSENHASERQQYVEQRAWAFSEVSVRRSRMEARGKYPADIERQMEVLESKWRTIGDGAIIMPLMPEGDDGSFHGHGRRPGGDEVRLSYSSQTGLAFETG